jgi:nucleotide-binding universal stress UspA family protein
MEEVGPFTRILVPTDGSEHSISAGLLAVRIASTHRIPVTFVYVIDTIAAEKMAGATGRTMDEVEAELRAKGQSYLDYLTRMASYRGLEADAVILPRHSAYGDRQPGARARD